MSSFSFAEWDIGFGELLPSPFTTVISNLKGNMYPLAVSELCAFASMWLIKMVENSVHVLSTLAYLLDDWKASQLWCYLCCSLLG